MILYMSHQFTMRIMSFLFDYSINYLVSHKCENLMMQFLITNDIDVSRIDSIIFVES